MAASTVHWTLYIYLEGQLPAIIQDEKVKPNMANIKIRLTIWDWHPGWPRRGLKLTSKMVPKSATFGFTFWLAVRLPGIYIYSSMVQYFCFWRKKYSGKIAFLVGFRKIRTVIHKNPEWTICKESSESVWAWNAYRLLAQARVWKTDVCSYLIACVTDARGRKNDALVV